MRRERVGHRYHSCARPPRRWSRSAVCWRHPQTQREARQWTGSSRKRAAPSHPGPCTRTTATTPATSPRFRSGSPTCAPCSRSAEERRDIHPELRHERAVRVIQAMATYAPHVINGSHFILFSDDPEADRAFFADVLGQPHVDAGGGWLIFKIPPAELAVHPADRPAGHELYFMY